jgi:hypothetical protein
VDRCGEGVMTQAEKYGSFQGDLISRQRNLMVIILPSLMITCAEMFLYTGNTEAAAFIHAVILVLLAFSSVFVHVKQYSILQVFMLLPLLRLLNISMPLFFDMTLYYFVFIYFPLIIPIIFIIKGQGLTLSDLGIREGTFKIQYIPVAVAIASIIAIMEFQSIHAEYLIPDLGIENLLKLSFIMIVFVGLTEELIFRVMLQTKFEAKMGGFWGLLLASFLFGIMHSGYGTAYEMLVTFSAGLILGYLFQRTRSLFFISLTHGVVNVFLFGIYPHLL